MKRKKAVALKYPPEAAAPFVAAKTRGEAAERAAAIAEAHGVPIVRNEELTEALLGQEIGAFVPAETWEILAKIFAFVIMENEQKKV